MFNTKEIQEIKEQFAKGGKSRINALLKLMDNISLYAEGKVTQTMEIVSSIETDVELRKNIVKDSELNSQYQELYATTIRKVSDALLKTGLELFANIPREEWYFTSPKDKKIHCPRKNQLVDFFNNTSTYFLDFLVQSGDAIEQFIQKFIFTVHLAYECCKQDNYLGAQSILAVWEDAAIYRLVNVVQKYLPESIKDKISEIEKVFSSESNSKYLRELLAQGKDILPFVGLFETDLTFAHDGTNENKVNEDGTLVYSSFAATAYNPRQQRMDRIIDEIEVRCDLQQQLQKFRKLGAEASSFAPDIRQSLDEVRKEAYKQSLQILPRGQKHIEVRKKYKPIMAAYESRKNVFTIHDAILLINNAALKKLFPTFFKPAASFTKQQIVTINKLTAFNKELNSEQLEKNVQRLKEILDLDLSAEDLNLVKQEVCLDRIESRLIVDLIKAAITSGRIAGNITLETVQTFNVNLNQSRFNEAYNIILQSWGITDLTAEQFTILMQIERFMDNNREIASYVSAIQQNDITKLLTEIRFSAFYAKYEKLLETIDKIRESASKYQELYKAKTRTADNFSNVLQGLVKLTNLQPYKTIVTGMIIRLDQFVSNVGELYLNTQKLVTEQLSKFEQQIKDALPQKIQQISENIIANSKIAFDKINNFLVADKSQKMVTEIKNEISTLEMELMRLSNDIKSLSEVKRTSPNLIDENLEQLIEKYYVFSQKLAQEKWNLSIKQYVLTGDEINQAPRFIKGLNENTGLGAINGKIYEVSSEAQAIPLRVNGIVTVNGQEITGIEERNKDRVFQEAIKIFHQDIQCFLKQHISSGAKISGIHLQFFSALQNLLAAAGKFKTEAISNINIYGEPGIVKVEMDWNVIAVRDRANEIEIIKGTNEQPAIKLQTKIAFAPVVGESGKVQAKVEEVAFKVTEQAVQQLPQLKAQLNILDEAKVIAKIVSNIEANKVKAEDLQELLKIETSIVKRLIQEPIFDFAKMEKLQQVRALQQKIITAGVTQELPAIQKLREWLQIVEINLEQLNKTPKECGKFYNRLTKGTIPTSKVQKLLSGFTNKTIDNSVARKVKNQIYLTKVNSEIREWLAFLVEQKLVAKNLKLIGGGKTLNVIKKLNKAYGNQNGEGILKALEKLGIKIKHNELAEFMRIIVELQLEAKSKVELAKAGVSNEEETKLDILTQEFNKFEQEFKPSLQVEVDPQTIEEFLKEKLKTLEAWDASLDNWQKVSLDKGHYLLNKKVIELITKVSEYRNKVLKRREDCWELELKNSEGLSEEKLLEVWGGLEYDEFDKTRTKVNPKRTWLKKRDEWLWTRTHENRGLYLNILKYSWNGDELSTLPWFLLIDKVEFEKATKNFSLEVQNYIGKNMVGDEAYRIMEKLLPFLPDYQHVITNDGKFKLTTDSEITINRNDEQEIEIEMFLNTSSIKQASDKVLAEEVAEKLPIQLQTKIIFSRDENGQLIPKFESVDFRCMQKVLDEISGLSNRRYYLDWWNNIKDLKQRLEKKLEKGKDIPAAWASWALSALRFPKLRILKLKAIVEDPSNFESLNMLMAIYDLQRKIQSQSAVDENFAKIHVDLRDWVTFLLAREAKELKTKDGKEATLNNVIKQLNAAYLGRDLAGLMDALQRLNIKTKGELASSIEFIANYEREVKSTEELNSMSYAELVALQKTIQNNIEQLMQNVKLVMDDTKGLDLIFAKSFRDLSEFYSKVDQMLINKRDESLIILKEQTLKEQTLIKEREVRSEPSVVEEKPVLKAPEIELETGDIWQEDFVSVANHRGYQEDRGGRFGLGNLLSNLTEQEITECLNDAVLALGEDIVNAQKSGKLPNKSKEGYSGSTLIFSVVIPCADPGKNESKIITVNVGDSVAFLASRKASESWTCERLNKKLHDADEPEEQARIEAAGGKVIAKRINGIVAVSRSLGDVNYLEAGLNYQPDIIITTVSDDQDVVLVVGCDGIYEGEDIKDVDAVVATVVGVLGQNEETQRTLARELTKIAVANGTHDNITAVVNSYAANAQRKPECLWVADGHDGQTVSECIKQNLLYFITKKLFEHLTANGRYDFSVYFNEASSQFDKSENKQFAKMIKAIGNEYIAKMYNLLGTLELDDASEKLVKRYEEVIFEIFKSEKPAAQRVAQLFSLLEKYFVRLKNIPGGMPLLNDLLRTFANFIGRDKSQHVEIMANEIRYLLNAHGKLLGEINDNTSLIREIIRDLSDVFTLASPAVILELDSTFEKQILEIEKSLVGNKAYRELIHDVIFTQETHTRVTNFIFSLLQGGSSAEISNHVQLVVDLIVNLAKYEFYSQEISRYEAGQIKEFYVIKNDEVFREELTKLQELFANNFEVTNDRNLNIVIIDTLSPVLIYAKDIRKAGTDIAAEFYFYLNNMMLKMREKNLDDKQVKSILVNIMKYLYSIKPSVFGSLLNTVFENTIISQNALIANSTEENRVAVDLQKFIFSLVKDYVKDKIGEGEVNRRIVKNRRRYANDLANYEKFKQLSKEMENLKRKELADDSRVILHEEFELALVHNDWKAAKQVMRGIREKYPNPAVEFFDNYPSLRLWYRRNDDGYNKIVDKLNLGFRPFIYDLFGSGELKSKATLQEIDKVLGKKPVTLGTKFKKAVTVWDLIKKVIEEKQITRNSRGDINITIYSMCAPEELYDIGDGTVNALLCQKQLDNYIIKISPYLKNIGVDNLNITLKSPVPMYDHGLRLAATGNFCDYEKITDATKQMDEDVKSKDGDLVYTHCFSGMERSVILILAYLINCRNMSLIAASRYVTKKRKLAKKIKQLTPEQRAYLCDLFFDKLKEGNNLESFLTKGATFGDIPQSIPQGEGEINKYIAEHLQVFLNLLRKKPKAVQQRTVDKFKKIVAAIENISDVSKYLSFSNKKVLDKLKLVERKQYIAQNQGRKDYQEDRGGYFEFKEDLSKLSDEQIKKCLKGVIDKLGADIIAKQENGEMGGQKRLSAGSTLVFSLVLSDGRIFTVNIGDSAAFLIKKRVDGNWAGERLNVLHKPNVPEEKRRINEKGGFVAPNGRIFSSVGSLAVSRALGDIAFSNIGVSYEPDITVTTLAKGQEAMLVVGCDGLHEELGVEGIAGVVGKTIVKSKLAQELVAEAKEKSRSGDNITVVAADACFANVEPATQAKIFWVADGHGGAEVSEYVSQNFESLMQTELGSVLAAARVEAQAKQPAVATWRKITPPTTIAQKVAKPSIGEYRGVKKAREIVNELEEKTKEQKATAKEGKFLSDVAMGAIPIAATALLLHVALPIVVAGGAIGVGLMALARKMAEKQEKGAAPKPGEQAAKLKKVGVFGKGAAPAKSKPEKFPPIPKEMKTGMSAKEAAKLKPEEEEEEKQPPPPTLTG